MLLLTGSIRPTGLGRSMHLQTRSLSQDKKAEGVGLVLWGDLKILMDSPEVNDGSAFWKNQHTWKVSLHYKPYRKDARSLTGYLSRNSRYVVPTGRYVVPAGKVIIIVSPGRLSLVPTGRILSPGKVK
ncbi:hypothetical protein Tco_0508233 [Tanacetum coccineum]